MITTLLLLILFSSTVLCDAKSNTTVNSPFDAYGEIEWENETARLDNFAIALLNDDSITGYIFVSDRTGGCPGEAATRAVRAKRYLTERRGVPWNRVMWRRVGYESKIDTTLVLAPKKMIVLNWREPSGEPVDGPLTRACRTKLSRIKKSGW